MRPVVIFLMLVFVMPVSYASEQDVLMIRSSLTYPEAMTVLQNAIIDHKYTLSRVQRIDVGLEKAGYKTDRYRIVFFGKQDEIKSITDKYPEMAAFLPLKFVLFAEENDTMLVALNPLHFNQVVTDGSLKSLFKSWAVDIKAIMNEVMVAE
jgi:uncharacterized protein (DUF302 family)